MKKLKFKDMSVTFKKLYLLASRARKNSYSPYSKYKVGAALRNKKGKFYAGCNVENSSYGGAICAERSAIVSAVSAEGQLEITEIVVVTDESPPWPPCGICRQVISEFATPATKIHAANMKGEILSFTFEELVPEAFTPLHLARS